MSKIPEQLAREQIDHLLSLAGLLLQDREEFDQNPAEGIAVREFSLPNGEFDYLLLWEAKAAGTIEAKKARSTLSGDEVQSFKYILQTCRASGAVVRPARLPSPVCRC